LVSDDKKHAVFKFEIDGGEVAVAYPGEHLPVLVQAAAACHSIVDDRPKFSDREVQVFPVNWFELGFGPEGEFILSLRIDGGGFLSFGLPPGMIPKIQESLAVMTGAEPNPPKPGSVLS